MPSKKRAYLQQFGIIHLSNPDLTYIRNLREKQNYIYALPPIENLNQEPFSVIYFFFHPPTWLETTMPTARRARIFTRWRLIFSKLSKIAKSFAKLLEEYF